MSGPDTPHCPLCDRPIPAHARQSVHHLIPKLKGGAHGPRVSLHEICHRKIHAVFTETELARRYNTVEALKAHPEIADFVTWLSGKDPAFHAPTYTPTRGPGSRRRR